MLWTVSLIDQLGCVQSFLYFLILCDWFYKAVLHLRKTMEFFFFNWNTFKNMTFRKKTQVKITTRSKVMPVFFFFFFSLRRHLPQTIKIGANSLCNSLLNTNKRFLISRHVSSQFSWILVQNEKDYSLTLFVIYLEEGAKRGPLFDVSSQILQSSFKAIYRDQTTIESSKLETIYIFRWKIRYSLIFSKFGNLTMLVTS